MAQLVFIKEICSSSWLHWSHRVKGDSSRLRDFRGLEKCNYRTTQIKAFLRHHGNRQERAPRIPITDKEYWRDQLEFHNIDSGVKHTPYRERLLGTFKNRVKPLLEKNANKRLREELKLWKKRFQKIVKKSQFNHWDDDDAACKQCFDKGIGWTANMLEYCRCQGLCQYIDTKQKALDFALIAMELNLGISSKDNQFQHGRRDFIKPDGLGLRRDGSFCVIEVKGPQDDPNLLTATLQGVCGALAICAKRDMIVRIAREKIGRRPSFKVGRIPQRRCTVGVYVLVSARIFQWDEKLEERCKLILNVFPELKEIVYFKVDTSQCGNFSTLPVFRQVALP